MWILTLDGLDVEGNITIDTDSHYSVQIAICTMTDSTVTGVDSSGKAGIIVNNPSLCTLTLEGPGLLTVAQGGISLDGGNDNALVVAQGAQVSVANGRVSACTSGGVDGTVQVEGSLNINADSDSAVYTGQVKIGSSGVLAVKGTIGLALHGMNSGFGGSYESSLVFQNGGKLEADCTEAAVVVYGSADSWPDDPSQVIVGLPDSVSAKWDSGQQVCSITAPDDVLTYTDGTFTGALKILTIIGGQTAESPELPTGDEEDTPQLPDDDYVPLFPMEDDSEPNYSVLLPDRLDGGEISVKKRYADEGEIFRFTLTPQEGYELNALSAVYGRGRTLDLEYEGGGTYSFEMPAEPVTIQAAFRAIVTEPEPLPFADVAENAWYAQGVRYVYENGLMAGVSDRTFAPDETASRSMIAVILWRMAGSPGGNEAVSFSDAPQGQWYSQAVSWAASQGIVSGYGDTFGTNDPVTREQLALMFYRFAQSQGWDVSVGENSLLSYTDADALSEYAVSAMEWACGAGVISGSGSALDPQGEATRAQTAVMLMQLSRLAA